MLAIRYRGRRASLRLVAPAAAVCSVRKDLVEKQNTFFTRWHTSSLYLKKNNKTALELCVMMMRSTKKDFDQNSALQAASDTSVARVTGCVYPREGHRSDTTICNRRLLRWRYNSSKRYNSSTVLENIFADFRDSITQDRCRCNAILGFALFFRF